jgi:magnesium chelatase accessory protein
MQPLTIPQDWPHRDASRLIACPPHLWHVQAIGAGPEILLLHGAGGGTHSWRSLMPLLAAQYRVIAVDLPGQGFSRLGARSRCGLDPMATDIAALCKSEGWNPVAIIGHSAGAVLALRLSEMLPLRAVIGINAAIGGFEGVAGWLFPAMARLLAMTPMAAQVFSRMSGTTARTQTLLASTGSKIDAAALAQYRTLISNPGHVDATLAMMAQWKLDGLLARLPGLTLPVLLITASGDITVPPAVSQKAAALLPAGEWANIPGYGHLVHEENAGAVAGLVLPYLLAHGAA